MDSEQLNDYVEDHTKELIDWVFNDIRKNFDAPLSVFQVSEGLSASGIRRIFPDEHPQQFTPLCKEIYTNDPLARECEKDLVMAQQDQIRDAIIRVQISLPSTQETNLRDGDIRKVLHEAYHVTIAKEVQRTTRLRIGNITPEELTPLEALAKYIASKNDLNPEQAKLINSYGSKLIKEKLSEDTT